MPESRSFRAVLVTPDKPVALNPDTTEGKLVEYNGKEVSLQL